MRLHISAINEQNTTEDFLFLFMQILTAPHLNPTGSTGAITAIWRFTPTDFKRTHRITAATAVELPKPFCPQQILSETVKTTISATAVQTVFANIGTNVYHAK